MNKLINDGGDFRTAPATPGLLNTMLFPQIQFIRCSRVQNKEGPIKGD